MHNPSQHQRLQNMALLAAMVLILIWGANFTVQKYLLTILEPSSFLMCRYVVMPVCALIMFRIKCGDFFPPLPRADWLPMTILGLIGHSLHTTLAAWGAHWSTPFSSSVILACGPLFTLLILRIMKLERMGARQLTGVTVACMGVMIFLSQKIMHVQWQASLGDLILLTAACSFSLYTIKTKPMIERHGSWITMGYATLIGSVPIFFITASLSWEHTAELITPTIAFILFLSVFMSAFMGWLVWGWINAVRGVSKSAPLMYLMPVVAGVFSWLITGEEFTTTKILGGLMALAGVALSQFNPNPTQI